MRFAITMLLLCVCGCTTQTDRLNALKKPVKVAAIGETGVLLAGADGAAYLACCDTYLGGALKNVKVVDTLIP